MNTDQWLITPDLSEAVELSGGAMPPGIYKARIEGVEKKVTNATKDMPANAQVSYPKWTLVIFGAEGDLARYNNWKVYHNTMMSGKGAGIFKSFYKAATNTEFTGGAFAPGDLIGKEVEVTLVEGRPYNGEPSKFPEVKAVKPLTPF